MKTQPESRLGKRLMWLAFLAAPFLLLLIPVIAINATAQPVKPVRVASGSADPDAFDKGVDAYYAGEYEAALGYLTQVPSTHPEYAKAMRFVGWGIYANELGRPEEGVAYVNRSMAAAPLDGNVWQDLSRTYGDRLLGMVGLGKTKKTLP